MVRVTGRVRVSGLRPLPLRSVTDDSREGEEGLERVPPVLGTRLRRPLSPKDPGPRWECRPKLPLSPVSRVRCFDVPRVERAVRRIPCRGALVGGLFGTWGRGIGRHVQGSTGYRIHSPVSFFRRGSDSSRQRGRHRRRGRDDGSRGSPGQTRRLWGDRGSPTPRTRKSRPRRNRTRVCGTAGVGHGRSQGSPPVPVWCGSRLPTGVVRLSVSRRSSRACLTPEKGKRKEERPPNSSLSSTPWGPGDGSDLLLRPSRLSTPTSQVSSLVRDTQDLTPCGGSPPRVETISSFKRPSSTPLPRCPPSPNPTRVGSQPSLGVRYSTGCVSKSLLLGTSILGSPSAARVLVRWGMTRPFTFSPVPDSTFVLGPSGDGNEAVFGV